MYGECGSTSTLGFAKLFGGLKPTSRQRTQFLEVYVSSNPPPTDTQADAAWRSHPILAPLGTLCQGPTQKVSTK